jgi:hypothetical protein
MHRAALLYNPLSGRRRKHRIADVEAAASILQSAGVEKDRMDTSWKGDSIGIPTATHISLIFAHF